MKLAAYLNEQGLSQKDFAEKFKPVISQGLISQWLAWLEDRNSGTRVTAERALEIERVTKGAVSAAELRPDIFSRKAA